MEHFAPRPADQVAGGDALGTARALGPETPAGRAAAVGEGAPKQNQNKNKTKNTPSWMVLPQNKIVFFFFFFWQSLYLHCFKIYFP